jgi:hypothetical protein
MTDDHVDGNAIGGMLLELFGREMTVVRGCCANCGSVHQVGEMIVFQGMGDVMRCPTCGNVVIVAVTIEERTRVHLDALRWLEPPTGG